MPVTKLLRSKEGLNKKEINTIFFVVRTFKIYVLSNFQVYTIVFDYMHALLT